MKKKNVIFKKIVVFYFVSTSISVSAVTLLFISAVKTTMKIMKPVRQKLINEIRAKADFYEVIL